MKFNNLLSFTRSAAIGTHNNDYLSQLDICIPYLKGRGSLPSNDRYHKVECQAVRIIQYHKGEMKLKWRKEWRDSSSHSTPHPEPSHGWRNEWGIVPRWDKGHYPFLSLSEIEWRDRGLDYRFRCDALSHIQSNRGPRLIIFGRFNKLKELIRFFSAPI